MRILQFAFNPRRRGVPTGIGTVNGPWSIRVRTTTTPPAAGTNSAFAHAAQTGSPDDRRRQMAADARVELDRIRAYTRHFPRRRGVRRNAARAVASPALTAMFPIRDALDEGAEAREMNVPGIAEENWAYRVAADALSPGACPAPRQT